MNPSSRYALAISHPSHELRVYGWVERNRPIVYVLTDGGGRSQLPRLQKTAELLDQLGATTGAVFGRIPDLDLYAAILDVDVALFRSLAEEIAADLIARRIDVIAGDAAEGYSAAHDTWRILIDAAVMLVRDAGHEIENRQFFVVAPPDEIEEDAQGVQRVILDEGEFERKIAAVRACSPTLSADVDEAMAGGQFYGVRHFMEPQVGGKPDVALNEALTQRLLSDRRFRERMASLSRGFDLAAFHEEIFWLRDPSAPLYASVPPLFEAYGEELVRAGRYERVIRYDEHLLPIAEALKSTCEATERSASRGNAEAQRQSR